MAHVRSTTISGILVLLTVSGLAACTAFWRAAPAAGAASQTAIVLKEGQDEGRIADVPLGGHLNIQLASNPSTGFSWSVAEQPRCLEFVSKDAADPEGKEPAVGVPKGQVFRFEAVARGEGILRLNYSRAWEKGKSPAKSFKAVIRVK